jgi:phosphoglycolate phosphatase-like HAD superfamily hydrolase
LANLIILDFDGVLADTLSIMLRITEQVTADLGYPCQPSAADLESLERMEFSELGRQLGLPEARVEDFVRGSFEGFAVLESPPPIFSGMAEAVQELAKDHRIAIVTGNTRRTVAKFLEVNGLDACVDVILTAEDPGDRSEKLKRILAGLGDGVDRRFMVGDAVSDVRAAKENGLISVGVAWGHQSEAKLRRAGVDYMARTPEELVEVVGSQSSSSKSL